MEYTILKILPLTISYHPVSSPGYFGCYGRYFFALFSIAISAAETAVAIAIMINIYRNIRKKETVEYSEVDICCIQH